MQGLLQSRKSEFLAVYGRRRVGKTFLIRTAYEEALPLLGLLINLSTTKAVCTIVSLKG
jgi:AAA+ ATPase superfamily predicted ATPase